MSHPNDFPIWKTIKIGTGLKSADDFIRAFKASNIYVEYEYVHSMMNNDREFHISPKERLVNLVLVSGADLGFSEQCIISQEKVCKRATEEIGLEICPGEIGPQLRLQLEKQEERGVLRIGMKPIQYKRMDPGWFKLFTNRFGVRCLVDESYSVYYHYAWVFIKP